MRVLRILVLVLAALAALVMAYAFALPRRVRVERSTTIDVPQATVYTLVSGLRALESWSPWPEAGATEAGATASGAMSEVRVDGTKASWPGGSLEIVDALPMERVHMRVDVGAGHEATAEIRIVPASGATRVTWGFEADVGTNPLARYLGRRFDGWIGPQLETGLARLKSLAEQMPRADFADLEVTLVDAVPVLVAYTVGPPSSDPRAMLANLAAAYARIDKFIAERRLIQAGARIRVPTRKGDRGSGFEAAVPIDHEPDKPVPARSPVQIHRSPGGTALRAVHRGALADVPQTHAKLVAFAAVHGHEVLDSSWDEFASNPATTAEADLVTHVFVAVKPSS